MTPNEQALIDASSRRSALSWRSPAGPIYQLPLLVISLLTVLAPADVLDRNSLAATLANKGRLMLLGVSEHADIARFADSTAFPQVALLACALHWLWLPCSVGISIAIFEYVRSREGYVVWRHVRGNGGRLNLADAGVFLAGVLMGLAAVVILTMVPGDWSLTPGLMTKSRIGLSLMLWGAFWCFGMTLGMSCSMLRIFVDVNLRGR